MKAGSEEWNGESEPVSVLKRINEERKKNAKENKELPPVDASELPSLPYGWVWTRLEL